MDQSQTIASLREWVDRFVELAVQWTPKVAVALVILIVGYIVAKSATALFARGLRKASVDETLVRFLRNIIYMLAMAFVMIAALSKLGINTTSLAAIFAAAGLAIGLALKDSLGNLASGVMLILNRPFKVGDYVEVAGVGGSVVETSVFATILNTPDNKRLIVPNGEITANIITNYSTNSTRRVDLTFGVSYSDDLGKAQQLFHRVVSEHPKVLNSPDVVIGVRQLSDSSINIIVRPWVKTEDYWTVWDELTEAIKNACDENGLSIPFPQRDVNLYHVDKAA
ncbi:MAG: mechanosensitive ion channel domain-containing protein [Pseudomonadota bacterium]